MANWSRRGDLFSVRIAVCDLGSFSAIFLVAEVRRGQLHPLREERHTIDLEYQRGTRIVGPGGLRRATRALRLFSTLARHYECEKTAVVTTAAIRGSSHRRLTLNLLDKVSPSPIQLLSHQEEARFAAEGALIGLRLQGKPPLVIDVGASSTEVVMFPRLSRGISTGAAMAAGKWSGAMPTLLGDCHAYLIRQAERALRRLNLDEFPSRSRVVGVGGTITTLAALHLGLRRFDSGRLHGHMLTKPWIADTAEALSRSTRERLEKRLRFDPERARILPAGTYLWIELLNRLNVDRVTVSARGLRWGVAARLADLD